VFDCAASVLNAACLAFDGRAICSYGPDTECRSGSAERTCDGVYVLACEVCPWIDGWWLDLEWLGPLLNDPSVLDCSARVGRLIRRQECWDRCVDGVCE
jgi:hypothetical protein